MVDESVDLFRLIGVNHQTGTLVRQQQIFILIDNVQFGLEEGEKEIFLIGLVKELVIDI